MQLEDAVKPSLWDRVYERMGIDRATDLPTNKASEQAAEQAAALYPGPPLPAFLGTLIKKGGAKLNSPRVEELLGDLSQWVKKSRSDMVEGIWNKLGKSPNSEPISGMVYPPIDRPEFEKLVGARLADIHDTEDPLKIARKFKQEMFSDPTKKDFIPGDVVLTKERKPYFDGDKYGRIGLKPIQNIFGKESLGVKVYKNDPKVYKSLKDIKEGTWVSIAEMLRQAQHIQDVKRYGGINSMGFKSIDPRIPTRVMDELSHDQMLRIGQRLAQIRKNITNTGEGFYELNPDQMEHMKQLLREPEVIKKIHALYTKTLQPGGNKALQLQLENAGVHANYGDLLSEWFHESLAKEAMMKDLEVHPELIPTVVRKLKLPQSE